MWFLLWLLSSSVMPGRFQGPSAISEKSPLFMTLDFHNYVKETCCCIRQFIPQLPRPKSIFCIAWILQVLFVSLLQTVGEVYMSLVENSSLINQNSHTRALLEVSSKPGVVTIALDTGLGEEQQLHGACESLQLLWLLLSLSKIGWACRSEMMVPWSPIPYMLAGCYTELGD